MIYVASSWRNQRQPVVVDTLHDACLDVYDFRNPAPGDHGFHWSEIDPEWKGWDPEHYIPALQHPLAVTGFAKDMAALRECSACLLVLPCGRSAHLELGWACGNGRPTAILLDPDNPVEPELMNKMVDLITADLSSLVAWCEDMVNPEVCTG